MKIILDLFITFLKISTFTLGGGPSMLPLIEKYAVNEKKWITKEEFVDMAALSQSIPGPIAVDAAVYIGYKSAGIFGSLAAVLGSVLSAFLALLLIAAYFTNINENKIVEAVFKGIRPAVVALLVLPVISMWKTSKINKKTVVIPIATVIMVAFFNVNAVYIIIASALGGFLYGVLRKRGMKH
ncbi:MAG: chromate transporter [Solirubrobacterales bacterium]